MSLEQLSLFSVQFPNDDCTSSSSSTTTGTCYSSSECTSRSGTASGTCAAGFGVCCVISTSTCGSTVSTNNTYIRNPGYPSSYTPTSTGTCTVTIKKVSDDVCQLREGIKIRKIVFKEYFRLGTIKFEFLPFISILDEKDWHWRHVSPHYCLLKKENITELSGYF